MEHSALPPIVATDAMPKQLVGLPLSIVGPVDVGRLLRELDALDNQILQAKLRASAAGGQPEAPRMTQLMEQTMEFNKLDLMSDSDRKQLVQLLLNVKERAPVLHMSFSADPATPFIEKLMAWLRREIHPVVLLTVGLQPNIGAGCIIRSTNKYFDCSLRKDFMQKKDILMSKLAAEEPAK
jgi:hypothetical protein